MVRSTPYLCLAIALTCMTVACRKQDSSSAAVPSSAVPPPLAPAIQQKTWAIVDQPLPSRDNPAKDGWQTEAFNSAAMAQLKHLGEAAIGKESPESSVEYVEPDLLSESLVPTQTETVHDDGLFRVERWNTDLEKSPSGANSPATQMDLPALLRPLQEAFSDYPDDRKYKFKIIRVEPSGDEVETTQFVGISGSGPQGSCEQNATWSIRWTHRNAQDPPRIKSIAVESFEQVTFSSPVPHLFTDCTESVLGKLPTYQKTLTQGIPYWRNRLSKNLGVYNLGHHGLAIGDVNGDGLDDLYVCQTGGLPNHLFVQQPDGTAVDVAAAAGVDYLDNSRSALIVDLDNDADQDLILALRTGLLFFENISNGDSVSYRLRARIPSVRQAFSLAAADYDHDADLDLFVCVYYGDSDTVSELPLPLPYFDATNGGGNFLIQNQGNWNFDDVTDKVGLGDNNSRFTLAATWEDYDNDGDSDLFVINDYGPNHLYNNADGIFTDVAGEVGLLDGAFGMSATFSDFDHNGRMDLYVSNMFSAAGNRITTQPQFKTHLPDAQKRRFQYLARGNSLFRNVADETFEDVSESHGVTIGRWSWGSLFADIDNNGWDDLLVANGYVTGESVDDL